MMRQNENERGRSRRARKLPVTDQVRHFLDRAQWKRKLASVLVATFLTGTMADGLNAAGLGNYANAYAATPSDATRSDAVHLDSDDLPAKGSSLDYYLDGEDDTYLHIPEAAIQEALEALEEDEDAEELQLDVGLLGYEDSRAVVAVYDEIQKETKGYQLVLQGKVEDEEDLSYFVYVKPTKKKSGPKFEELQVVVLNLGSAADEDSQYNVRLRYEGEDLRLENAKVTLKEMKELSRRQKKAAKEGEILIEVDGSGITGGGPGAGNITGGGQAADDGEGDGFGTSGSISGGGGSGGSAGGGSALGGASAGSGTSAGGSSAGSGSNSGSIQDGSAKPSEDQKADVEDQEENPGQGASDDRDPAGADQSKPEDGSGTEIKGDSPEDTGKDDSTADGSGSRNPSQGEAGGDQGSQGGDTGYDSADQGSGTDSGSKNEGTETENTGNPGSDAGSSAGSGHGGASNGQPGSSTSDRDTSHTESGSSSGTDGGSSAGSGHGGSSGGQTDSTGNDTSSAPSEDKVSAETAALTISRRWIPVVAEPLATGSNAEEKKPEDGDKAESNETAPEEKPITNGKTADTIEALREELAADGLKPYHLDPTGRFDMSDLEMELINKGELTEEDMEKAQGRENTFVNKLRRAAASILLGEEGEEAFREAGTEEMAESENAEEASGGQDQADLSLEDLVGPDSSEYPAVFGLRQNTIAFVRSKTGEQEKTEEEFIIRLPEFEFFIVGKTYDLLEDVQVVDPEGKELDQYGVRLVSVSRKNGDGEPEEISWKEEEGKALLEITRGDIGKTYTITYQAVDQGTGEDAGEPVQKEVPVRLDGGVEESLDRAGDVAYLTRVEYMDDSLRTGTLPFDTPDSKPDSNKGIPKPGEDKTDEDVYLRTYDTATFAVEIENTVRETEAGVGHFENGTICFELMLPCTPEEAMFNVGDMGWLKGKPYAYYEETVIDNHPVLRGSFLWERSAESADQPPIGAGRMQLNISVRALAMQNGTVLKPEATFWMGVNPVKDKDGNSGELIFAEKMDQEEPDIEGDGQEEESENADPEKPAHALRYDFGSMGLVTGVAQDCENHEEEEVKTEESPDIIISAAPSYNIQLKTDGDANAYYGTFNFSTGNQEADPENGKTKAANYGLPTVEGRAAEVGVVLQVRGKNGQGLRGVELPATGPGKSITFDLSLESTFQPTGKEMINSHNYQPLLWSAEGNSEAQAQADGREIAPGDNQVRCVQAAPYNQGGGYKSCHQGGIWSATQDGNTIHVKVEDFALSLDMEDIPHANAHGRVTDAVYYNPATAKNYWEADALCFSAGEFWILQPFTRTGEGGEEISVLNEYNCDSGSFTLKVRDKNLMMESKYGTPLQSDPNGVGNQANWDDIEKEDQVSLTYAHLRPGSFWTTVSYIKTGGWWDASLTEGCLGSGQDWTTVGSNLALQGVIYFDGKDKEEYGVAYDVMVKFDDAMFEPYGDAYDRGGAGEVRDGVRMTNDGPKDWKVLYGIRRPRAGSGESREVRGKNGWYNDGLTPEAAGYDSDMVNAKVEDIEFMPWSEFKPLRDEGYVCVAVLTEWRGVDVQPLTHCHMFVEGRVREKYVDSVLGEQNTAGHVYMISQYGKAWKKGDVREKVKEHYQSKGITITGEPSEDQYNDYVKHAMPSQYQKCGYGDYPHATHERVVTENEYRKTRYEDGKLKENGTGGDHWGDSCYIVGYKAKIKKGVSQTTKNSTTNKYEEKKIYDVGAGQWVVDYYLDPSIERSGGVGLSTDSAQHDLEQVVITDTLSEGLIYVPGSAQIGGTYSMKGEGIQGIVTDGEAKEPTITKRTIIRENEATKEEETIEVTDLVWTFDHVKLPEGEDKVFLPRIHYSCSIDPQKDLSETTKQIPNEVKIGGRGLSDVYTRTDENIADISIGAYKLGSTMLYKTADQSVVDIQPNGSASLGFQSNLVNSGSSEMDILFLDTMPYNGDAYGSSCGTDCDIFLTEWSLPRERQDKWVENLSFYYTTDAKYKDKTSSQVKAEELTDTVVWKLITPIWDEGRKAYVFTNLPENLKATAVVAAGKLPANQTISMHTTLKLSKARPGDNLAPTVSNSTMQSMARSYILTRAIEGLVWLDINHNGLQDSGEPKLRGIQVTLTRKADGEDKIWGTVETDEYGRYRFDKLSAGKYEVAFTSNANTNQKDAQLENYLITKHISGNDSRNSDATGNFDSQKKLQSAVITTIPEMSAVENIQSSQEVRRNWDLGLCLPVGAFGFRKVDAAAKNIGLEGAEFELTGDLSKGTANNYEYWAKERMRSKLSDPSWQSSAGITSVTTDFKDETKEFTIRFKTTEKKVDFTAGGMEWLLPFGNYTLKEIKAPLGYEMPETLKKDGYHFTISQDAPEVNGGEIENTPQQFAVKKIAEETEQPISGVTFRLYEGSVADNRKKRWEATTDGSGVILFGMTGLKVNQIYRLEEEKVSGYETMDPIFFMLVSGAGSDSRVSLQLTDEKGSPVSGTADVSLTNENSGDGEQQKKNVITIRVMNTLETGSLTLAKKVEDTSITSIPGLEDAFEFTLRLAKPESEKEYVNFVKSSELRKGSKGLEIRGYKGEKEEETWYPIAEGGTISGIKLKIGEQVRFDGIYYGTKFTITENQSVKTGFIFDKVTTSRKENGEGLDDARKVTYGDSSQIQGTLLSSDGNLTVYVYNRIQKTGVTLSKTFDSDVPAKLPVFSIYDVTDIPEGQRIPVGADGQGTVSKDWKSDAKYSAYQTRNPVGTISITKAENEERYEGKSAEDCLMPGRKYQIIEELGDDIVAGYYNVAVSKVFSVAIGENNQISCEPITLGNHRAFGFLNVKKLVKDYDNKEMNAITRTFYYKILKADGSDFDGTVYEITTNKEEQHVVPFGTYQIIEVDSQGNPYEGSTENPGYAVTNSETVTVELNNGAGNQFTGTITNKEKALGEVTVTKMTDYAERGTRFYFKVTDGKDQVVVRRPAYDQADFISSEEFETRFKADYLWTITADKKLDYEEEDQASKLYEAGRFTIHGLPYGTYTVTEVNAKGEPITGETAEGFAYTPSYQIFVGSGEGNKKDGASGTISIGNSQMAVTVTNRIKKTNVTITKTFTPGFVPDADNLPTFDFYQLSGRDEITADTDLTNPSWEAAKVGTVSIQKQPDGTYSGQSEDVLIPGYRYQAVETITDWRYEERAIGEPFTAETASDEKGSGITMKKTVTLSVENQRTYGDLRITKELFDYYGTKLGEDGGDIRTFYFRIKDQKGAYLTIQTSGAEGEEGKPGQGHQCEFDPTVGRITNAADDIYIHHRIPYGTYTVEEVGVTVAEDGKVTITPYETEKKEGILGWIDSIFGKGGENPDYHVVITSGNASNGNTSSGNTSNGAASDGSASQIVINHENADSAAVVIQNTERALGELTVTKQADYAGKGTRFYFQVTDGRGQFIGRDKDGIAVLSGEFTPDLLWTITAEEDYAYTEGSGTSGTDIPGTDIPETGAAARLHRIGALTTKGLPYGVYTVTETDQEGNPLAEDYSYAVSYQMEVSGEGAAIPGSPEASEADPNPGSPETSEADPNPASLEWTEAGQAPVSPELTDGNRKGEVLVTNERSWGYLQIRKELQDCSGNPIQDKSRDFYYTVRNAQGEPVILPEEYQYNGNSQIGRITDDVVHRLYLPLGAYQVLETDSTGKAYDSQNPNLQYDVTNPEEIKLSGANADTAQAVIINKEKALGSLTLVKRSDRAYEGNTFYFQVKNSRGEAIPMPDAEGNPTTERIWRIGVTKSVYELAEVGNLTIKNLPYDTYTVTEVNEDGTELTGSFRYQVSYETVSQGVIRPGQGGENDIISPTMTVTVTNTWSPYGNNPGGPGGGGNGGGGGNPSRSTTPPTEFIPDADVPLGGMDGGEGDSLTEILDEDVPLYGLPKTGDTSLPTVGILGLMLMSLIGAAGIMKKRKEEK